MLRARFVAWRSKCNDALAVLFVKEVLFFSRSVGRSVSTHLERVFLSVGGVLRDGIGLAREGRLVHLEVGRFDNAHIRGHLLAGTAGHDVPGHQQPRLDGNLRDSRRVLELILVLRSKFRVVQTDRQTDR